MIADVNKTIRELLLVDGRIDLTEIDISFELPNREWSARMSKPTINCYLFDLRERPGFREQGWIAEQQRGQRTRRQPPLYIALTYLITAWTSDVEDEHRLLWLALQTLSHHPRLPEARLQGLLRELPAEYAALSAEIAQADSVLKSPGEFWTALENHLKPSINYTVTVPLDREAELLGPPVRFTRLLVQSPTQVDAEQVWAGGVIRSAKGERVAAAQVQVVDHPAQAVSDDLGRYRLAGLAVGTYTIIIHAQNQQSTHTITVPEQTDITLT